MNTLAKQIESEFKNAGVDIKLTDVEKHALEMRKLGASRDSAQQHWNGKVYKFWNGDDTPIKRRNTKRHTRATVRDRRILKLKEALNRGLIDASHQTQIFALIHSLENRSKMDERQKFIYKCVKAAVKKARTKEYNASRLSPNSDTFERQSNI